MTTHDNGLTRRSFIGLGAVLAAGATAGLAGCAPRSREAGLAPGGGSTGAAASADWLGEEPALGSVARTEECDLLIVGAGTAGLAAAATAADLGLDFILCEKTGTVQETREYFGAVDSPYQQAMQIAIDKPKLLNELTRYASGKCNQEVLKVWIDESGETVAWFDALMQEATGKPCVVDVTPEHATGGTDYYLPTLQHVWLTPYEPPTRNDVFAAHIEQAGRPARFNWTMTRLIHEGGKVTGALFDTDEGTVQVNAKNTLLATGGYPANPAMMEALSPATLAVCTASSFAPANTGEGIKAGLWAGASKDRESATMIFDRGAVAPGVTCGYVGEGDARMLPGTIFQENIGSQPFMKVNLHGKRFVNESMPYDFLCNAAGQQPGGVWCQVFDANASDDILRFDTIGCSAFAKQMMAVGMPVEEFCAASAEQGILKKADTLEDLADQLGFEGADKESFLAQIERYNAQFDAQIDDDFGKEAYRLSAIRQAPFYGCWFGGTLLTTIDGLTINKHCQVLDGDGEVIEGLFAAGDCSGSFFSGNYPEYLVGVACGRSTTQGRHVARYLAGEIS
ncbi:FAD-binding protein [Adlercreutzia faecimuris]|uniref:FAD-binding protein n=1 Tax=Adlercreutzia faecimuris TaxID=2897341 RepID=A0ABS9WIH5_9ACTN|nr:FAD-binding protein [Adlercreutzia sp. JBNU-10]MCI2242604.1 FAD-binding protein [Adlercreutzia sp. JBNU-10]